jgi:prepilin-type N-terminal cleavage/methylation domain-containing protein
MLSGGGELQVRKSKKFLGFEDGGFTLIELMLVIVIIGILSAVIIGVINPLRIQNRAKDATVKSTMQKIALATSAYVSATGVIPSGSGMLNELMTSVTPVSGCIDTTAACLFVVAGEDLPSTCTASTWNTTGTASCDYFYCGSASTDMDYAGCTYVSTSTNYYRIFARNYISGKTFMFRSFDSRMYECSATGTACVIIP